MKLLISTLLTLLCLHANTSFPELFSQLGTPLYKADRLFAKLPEDASYSQLIKAYHINQDRALEIHERGNKQVYFKALRSLNKEYENILRVLKRELHNAIKTNDYPRFLTICNAGIDALYEQKSFETSVFQYYLSHKQQGKSAYLDKRIRTDKAYEKHYGADISSHAVSERSSSHHARQNPLILLTTTWCGQCKKAKRFLRKNGIAYTEYDAEKSSKGRELMKKHHGTGYPTFIIGNESRSGLSPRWLSDRLY